ncbi:ComEC/Rec2 family competence protein [Thalassobaculum sp. OXR-137]|uniref:ComEC/Rec2 family competence protein n=1 Tax=Thalassobaculum sp. OXR-137 TaxID=3100173 RepID=UPI002AC91B91|nr:ComEC/Rec2 family competence protein [Thalassobaculum sp. OXR-137]WPZ32858.1 ComEC/Rec2 family competence protein [Thalassobaculum sp. OXR-137]
MSSTGLREARPWRHPERPAAPAAGADGRPLAVRRPAPRRDPLGAFRRAFAADRARWPLWLPVAFAAGIALYFALPSEPPLAAALVPAPAVAAAAWGLRGREPALWCALLLLFATLGLGAAALRTAATQTVLLTTPIWAQVEGVVERVEKRPGDVRLTLIEVQAAGGARAVPYRVRIVCRRLERVPGIGDRVRLRARLTPPPPPSVPGGFDFQRSAFFDGLGAVGFAVGEPELVSAEPEGSLTLAVGRLRTAVADRLAAALPGPAGAVAAALIVGERAGLDEATQAAFRDSGLAHLLAISGLHMGLVAGTLFAGVRLALCLIPGVALRRPVKKIAACVALTGSVAYLVLAGAPVPTQRAFLMAAAVLSAVLVDREAVSLRLVALAAFAVLAIRPDVLTGASFQLSFAAVIALVAVHESWRRRGRRGEGGARRWMLGGPRYLAGVAVTSLVATAATAPFVTFHFQAIALGGLPANMLAVPLTAFVTMPAGIVALLAMPLGLEGWVLPVMGLGIDATLAVADRVVAWTGPAAGVHPLPVSGLAALSLGGCWLAIWRGRLRWFGLMPLAAGGLVWASVTPPDVLISADGQLSAVAMGDGGAWVVSTARGNQFSRSVWARRWGVEETVTVTAWDRDQEAEGAALACDDLGCTLRRRGQLLSLVASQEAAVEDCAAADVLVAVVRIRTACDGPRIVVHAPDLRRDGAHAVWLGPNGPRVESVRARRGERPWVPGGEESAAD